MCGFQSIRWSSSVVQSARLGFQSESAIIAQLHRVIVILVTDLGKNMTVQAYDRAVSKYYINNINNYLLLIKDGNNNINNHSSDMISILILILKDNDDDDVIIMDVCG